MNSLFLIMFVLQMGIFALLIFLIFKNKAKEDIQHVFEPQQNADNNVEFILPL